MPTYEEHLQYYWNGYGGCAEIFRGREAEGERGVYWWSCIPGCIPDGLPWGPFDTEEEAIEDYKGD